MTDDNVMMEEDGVVNNSQAPGNEDILPLSYGIKETTNDWSFSPPTWPQSPFYESPPSASSASADYYHELNPFEQSFAAAQNNFKAGPSFNSSNAYQSASLEMYRGSFQPGDPRGNNVTYVSLPDIQEYSQRGVEYVEEDATPRPSQFMVLKDELQSRQPAWANGVSSKSNTRRKSSDRSTKPMKLALPVATINQQRSTHRLRSTASSTSSNHKSQISPLPSPTFSTHLDKPGPRANHNHVEKQYRNRLNGQFQFLLQTLPIEDQTSVGEKRVSKAEVLVLAKKHIMELERETRELEVENEILEDSVEGLKKRWVEQGGMVMP